MRNWLAISIFVTLALAAPSWAQAPADSLICTVTAENPRTLRPHGTTELVADTLVTCAGGQGSTPLKLNVTLHSNLPITSVVTGQGSATESLLLVNDPDPSGQIAQPAGSALPDQIIPNVFQGSKSDDSSLIFSPIVFLPPGSTGTRMLRILNVRVNAADLAQGGLATVSVGISGSVAVQVVDDTQTVGKVGQALSFQTRSATDAPLNGFTLEGCAGRAAPGLLEAHPDFLLKFTEGFASAFRERNVGTSVLGPDNLAAQTNLFIDYPMSLSSESGFYNPALPETQGLNKAGLATTGTRLMARFTGVPAGVSVWVSLRPFQTGTSGTGISARLMQADESGVGGTAAPATSSGYAKLTVSGGVAVAVWEILDPDGAAIESISFGVVLAAPQNTPASGTVQVGGQQGPVSSPESSVRPSFVAVNAPVTVATIQPCAAAGALQVNPSAENFLAISGGPAPVSEILSLTGTIPGLVVTTTATTEAGGKWLIVSPGTTQLPGFLEVSVDSTGLAPGTYNGTIHIVPQGTEGNGLEIPVVLKVTEAAPPTAAAEPREISLAVPSGAPTAYRSVFLVNNGSGQFNYTAQAELLSGTNWLSIMPASNTVTAKQSSRIGLQLNPAGLPAGTYRARIHIVTSLNQTFDIPVTLAVSAGADAMLLSQNGLSFTAIQDGPKPQAQAAYVLATGAHGFNWTASSSIDAGLPSWLSLSPASGTANPGQPSQFKVTVDPTGLGPAHYYGEITVAAQGPDNSPRVLFVTLDVLAPDGALPATLDPGGLVFLTKQGVDATNQTIAVLNPGGPAFDISAHIEGDAKIWSLTLPNDVSVASGQQKSITISAKSAGLAAGTYTADLVVQSGAGGPVKIAELLLLVTPVGTARSAAVQPRAADAACVAGNLQIVPLNPSKGFAVADNTPLPLELRVLDSGGTAFSTGSVSAAFVGAVTGDRSLVYIASDPGRWSGTLLPPSTVASAVAIRIYAEDPSRNLSTCMQISGTDQNTGAPVIADGGVVSPASFAGGNPVSPGGMVAIFGTGLATGTELAGSLPLPTLLGVTRGAIAGRPISMFFAGDLGSYSQINGVLPYGLTANVKQQLILRRGTQAAYSEIILADAMPSVFTVSQTGSGQAVAVHGANPIEIVDKDRPAAPGEIIVLYVEGLGELDNPVTAGQQTPLSPLSRASHPVTVTIGGSQAEVFFAGLTPGLAALYQINLAVPTNITAGDAVPVVVNVAGQDSAPVTIAVK